MKGIWILCLLFGASVQPCWGQAAAPPIDPTPLERPRPLCLVESKDPGLVLKALTDLLTKQGFLLRQTSKNEAWIEASRSDASSSDDSDRILIWLERDLNRPLEAIQVFLSYGRYMLILSGQKDIHRVRVNQATQDKRIGAVRDSIVRYCQG